MAHNYQNAISIPLGGTLLSGAGSVILESGKGALLGSDFPLVGKITKFDTDGVTVLKREIVNITNEVADVATITRAYETCPLSSTSSTLQQVAQDFDVGDILEVVLSKKCMDDIESTLVSLEANKLSIADYQNGTKTYAATSVGTDAYAIALSPAITAYENGMTFRFLTDVANTGGATLAVNGLTAYPIYKLRDQALASGDLEAGQIVMVTFYNNTWQMDSQIATIPTVDINGQSEKTTMEDNDEFVIYDITGGNNKKVKKSTLNNSIRDQMTVPLGESFTGATTPQAAVLINDLHQPGATSMSEVGRSGSNKQRLGLKITPRKNVTIESINAVLMLNSAAQDGLRFKIETDTAGSPSGSVITNGTSDVVSSSTLASNDKLIKNFTFSTPPTLTANTAYWIILEKSGAVQATNYDWVQICTDNYASFVGKFYNGSTWASADLMNLEIIPSTQGSYSLWLADNDHANLFMRQAHGLCNTTGSAGADGTLFVEGDVAGFSGLVPDTDYYLSTTAGAVGKSEIGMHIGCAKNATTITVKKRRMGAVITQGVAVSGIPSNMKTGKVKAPCDGFLLIFNNDNGTTLSDCAIEIFDGIAETNKRTYYVDDPTNGHRHSITIPIRKGQYWNVDTIGNGAAYIDFIPLI